MTGAYPKRWVKWLGLAEWWYNSTFHNSIRMTPFEALYGYVPPQLNLHQLEATKVPTVDEFMQQRLQVLAQLKENLSQAQHRMKQYADLKRTERSFEIGDMVFLKLHPCRQSSLALRSNFKLSPRFYGPFRVLERIGQVAYRLDLPPSSLIHPVFLKKCLGKDNTHDPVLPPTDPDGSIMAQPVAVLARRMVKRNNRAEVQWLVQLSNSLPEDATWEDCSVLEKRFPSFILEDKD